MGDASYDAVPVASLHTTSAFVSADAGQIDALSNQAIQHTYLLRNDTLRPLIVERLEASCGCTTAFVGTDSHHSLPFVLQPRAQVPIEVLVNPSFLSVGVFRKNVKVFLREREAPAATLELTGTLKAAVTCSPTFLNFDHARAGIVSSLPLTLYPDPRLVAHGELPPLKCSNPFIRITAINSFGNPSLQTSLPVPPKQTYEVTLLPTAPLGLVQGIITFAMPEDGSVSPALRRVSLYVFGEVSGDLAAMPASVAFGTVPSGIGATREVVLTSRLPNGLRELKLEVDGPYVTLKLSFSNPPDSNTITNPVNALNAHLAGDKPNPHLQKRALQITISPLTPNVLVNTTVTVTTKQGQKFVLPVTALILPPSQAK